MRRTTRFIGKKLEASAKKQALEALGKQSAATQKGTKIEEVNKIVEKNDIKYAKTVVQKDAEREAAKMAFSAKPEYGEVPQGKLKKAGSSSH